MAVMSPARITASTARLLRQICNRFFRCYSEPLSVFGGRALVYVCNCNGLRRRDVALAIESGACRPRDIFAANRCEAQCAKCVCEMRQMIQESRKAFALAAE